MNFDKINKQSEYEDLVNKGIEFAKTSFSKAETLFLKTLTIKNGEDSAYKSCKHISIIQFKTS